jgi:hypothetical protein
MKKSRLIDNAASRRALEEFTNNISGFSNDLVKAGHQRT